MNFRKVGDVRKFCQKTGFRFSTQHDKVLETALAPEAIDDIFRWIIQDSKRPLLYEIGCSAGYSTTQIVQRLKEKGIERYQLIACDIEPQSVDRTSKRFLADKRIAVELRSGLDYSGIETCSVDGIFSFNAMVPFLEHCLRKGKNLYRTFLKESSRVLKEGKPLILTWLWEPLFLVKDGRKSGIPFRVRLYGSHRSIRPFLQILNIKEGKNGRETN